MGRGQYANFATKHPPGHLLLADGTQLYYTEMIADTLFVKRIRTDGFDEKTLYKLPHSVRAVVSPDLKWIAFREYTRTFVTPLDYIGKAASVSPFDNQGTALPGRLARRRLLRLDPGRQGTGMDPGNSFYEKPLADVIAKRGAARATGLAVEYDVAVPAGVVALTNARVLTMDGARRVIENATVIIRGNRIERWAPGLPFPRARTWSTSRARP